MSSRFEDKYAAAYNDLKDRDAARRFLNVKFAKYGSSEREVARRILDERRGVSPAARIDKWVLAIRKGLRIDPEPVDTIRIERSRRFAKLDGLRRRAVAQATSLLATVRTLDEQCVQVEAEQPNISGLPSIVPGESHDAYVARARAWQTSFWSDLLSWAIEKGIPVDLAIGRGPLPSMEKALENMIDVHTRWSRQRVTRRSRAKHRPSEWLVPFLATNLNTKFTGKALAALECLARNVFPSTTASAARCCKRWDTALTRTRPKASAYYLKVYAPAMAAALRESAGRQRELPQTASNGRETSS